MRLGLAPCEWSFLQVFFSPLFVLPGDTIELGDSPKDTEGLGGHVSRY